MRKPAFSRKNSELRTTLKEIIFIVKLIFGTANHPGTRFSFFEMKFPEKEKYTTSKEKQKSKAGKNSGNPSPKPPVSNARVRTLS
ncbi:hypothetical protein [Desulfosarcina sp. BuS5]|uniref:hypothetical protein n=1 Tax=Desulfosarcina sp. BuS5 TaxID=933262 RepID=UPI0023795FFA|nr:hypothetical protein [Desulfosarcina sp. BuS5]